MAGETTMALVKTNLRSSDSAQAGLQPKNLLINGAMDVCQKTGHQPATVQSNVISGSNGVRIDRWNVGGSGGSGIDASIEYYELGNGFLTTNFKNAMRFNISAESASLNADDYVYAQQRIETKNLINRLNYGQSGAKKLTLSFWIYSTVTGKYGVSLINRKDTSSYRRRNIMSYTINTANTWEKKVITFVGDTDSSFNFDLTKSTTQPYLGVAWHFAAGTNRVASASTDYSSEGVWYTDNNQNVEYLSCDGQTNAFTSTSNDIYLTGCQLEIGEVATEFEHRHHSQTLNDCYRYLYVYMENATAGDTLPGRLYTSRYSNGGICHLFYPCVMYKTPNLTYTAAGGTVSSDYSSSGHLQLYDSDDVSWRIYNLVADAEIT